MAAAGIQPFSKEAIQQHVQMSQGITEELKVDLERSRFLSNLFSGLSVMSAATLTGMAVVGLAATTVVFPPGALIIAGVAALAFAGLAIYYTGWRLKDTEALQKEIAKHTYQTADLRGAGDIQPDDSAKMNQVGITEFAALSEKLKEGLAKDRNRAKFFSHLFAGLATVSGLTLAGLSIAALATTAVVFPPMALTILGVATIGFALLAIYNTGLKYQEGKLLQQIAKDHTDQAIKLTAHPDLRPNAAA